jgi:hypothetical protein
MFHRGIKELYTEKLHENSSDYPCSLAKIAKSALPFLFAPLAVYV